MLGLDLSIGGFLRRGEPVPTPSPVISITSGTGYAGSVYTSTVAGQWTADGVDISGATGTTYTMTFANEGKAIRCGLSNTITTWVPSLLPSISAIFDIRQGLTLSGASVAAWEARNGISGTQGAGASQPTYGATAFDGAPGLTLDGDDSLNGIAVNVMPVSRTFIGGVSVTDALKARTIFGPSTAGGYAVRRGSSRNAEVAAAPAAVQASSATTIPDATPVILTSRFTSSGPYGFRSGGVSIGTGTALGGFTAVSGTGRIGRQNNGDFMMIGVISTFLMADSYLSDEDTQKAEGWIAHTLGKASLLDASHPYKVNAPRIA